MFGLFSFLSNWTTTLSNELVYIFVYLTFLLSKDQNETVQVKQKMVSAEIKKKRIYMGTIDPLEIHKVKY